MKKISILGSTGSIGTSTLEVIEQHPDKFKVVALAAGKNTVLLARQIEKFQPLIVSVATQQLAQQLKDKLTKGKTKIVYGEQGLIEIATCPEADIIVCAIVGSAGLLSAYHAIKTAKQIALANKETLVMAGSLIMDELKKQNAQLIPIDSEHNAVFQILNKKNRNEIKQIILTASGGPFLNLSKEEMSFVTVEQALNHPNWNMGRKISIDSATLMNKGLEIIEAYWLFNLEIEQISTIVHPQSIVHSLVELIDGSLIAHMGITDMKIPIQYALSYPERLSSPSRYIALADLAHLEFLPPDQKRFPCLGLCIQALRQGKSMPAVLNASNEVAVEYFLQGKISFDKIPIIIKETMQKHIPIDFKSVEEIQHIDQWARNQSDKIAKGLFERRN
jgi:1-deoxy-D-xylulose-5-phosphate reductoisomerase